MESYVLRFADPEAEKPAHSGGKGASLSKLSRGGFPVPDGFIVTVKGYLAFIGDSPEVKKIIDNLPLGHPDKLVAATAALRKELSKRSLPENIAVEVKTALRETGEGAYSVRSSSTLEDLTNAAFAGQHDTYLNCVGEDEIIVKIRDCFVSLWQDRAVAYRHSKGFSLYEAAMAVVVQKMAQCEIAGVGFSVDPIAGRNAMLINSNYGLGESVVGGGTEVDQFVVDRDSRKVVESFIARKTVKVVSDSTGQGTREVALNDEESCGPSLDDKQIDALYGLMLRVEAFYRFPQDIEWGMEKGKLYLLQARPITSIAPKWTRDESAERYPTAMTPLSWDLIEEGFHKSLEHSFKLMGFPSFEGKWFAMFDNYIYGNQNAVRFYLGLLPFAPATPEELRAGIPEFVEKYDWALSLPSEWLLELDRYLLKLGALNAEPLNRDLEDLWDYVVRVSIVGGEYFRPNIAISITHAVLYRSLLGFIKLFAPGNALNLFDRITAYCETKTSLVNKELKKLVKIARADEKLARLLLDSPSEPLLASGALNGYPAFWEVFGRFLEDHGHREVEFDPYIPTWLDAPWVVLDNVRLILSVPSEDSREARNNDTRIKRAASEAESELFALLPRDLHLFFREIIRLVRLYTELDDVEHYQTTRMHLPMRRGLKALGEALVERGVLREPSDIYFARKGTVNACVGGTMHLSALTEETRVNKETYLTNRDRSPAWVLNADEKSEESQNENELTGLAGSPGLAEGSVFIVNSSDDFASFPQGAVLVAKTTNPTWTPLFYAAAALVTESGGPLSHGAVTAREISIPAVMSVRGVMSALKNGDKVRVNGSGGKVYKLESR
jgi:pyruvate,water dikinase